MHKAACKVVDSLDPGCASLTQSLSKRCIKQVCTYVSVAILVLSWNCSVHGAAAPRITGLIRKRPLDSLAMRRMLYPKRGFRIGYGWYTYGNCEWCGFCGCHGPTVPEDNEYKLRDVNRCHKLYKMCHRCIKLDEPPWRPNNRDRCDMWLQQVFGQSRMAKLDQPTQRLIAEMLADNDP